MTLEPQYDVFLSHHSNDNREVELLAHRLVDEVGLQPFLVDGVIDGVRPCLQF